MSKKTRLKDAFISIDIAFALLIMSFSFVILYAVSKSIINENSRKDIQYFSESNANLLNNINANISKNETLTTNSNKKYNVKMFSNTKGEILIHYYKIIP